MSEAACIKDDNRAVPFAVNFIGSQAFRDLFAQGMELVEDTAAYLDGQGRADVKLLDRDTSLAYAQESMKLTTRLMHVASWLLLQRAVADGEMSKEQADVQRRKAPIVKQDLALGYDGMLVLPDMLQILLVRSLRLQDRILHIDALLDGKTDAPVSAASARSNPVLSQLGELAAAFGAART